MSSEHIANLPPHVFISLNPHKIPYNVHIITPIFKGGSKRGSDEYKARILKQVHSFHIHLTFYYNIAAWQKDFPEWNQIGETEQSDEVKKPTWLE